MAKRTSPKPALTHTEILALAGQRIQSEILKLQKEFGELEGKNSIPELREQLSHIEEMTRERSSFHSERLRAIEIMYSYETGTALRFLEEIPD